jgi:tetratricopeptide (TPR) repeat protein
MRLSASADEEQLPKGPLWLGTPEEINANAEVEVPSGYRAEIPASVHLKKDFAEYDATYEFKDGKLISKRHLKTLLREVPVGEREEYKDFAKKLLDDYGLFISFNSGSESRIAASQPAPPASKTFDAIRNLSDSPNAEALRLEKEAHSALEKHDVQGALTSLYRATAADSQFTRAWVLLGGLLLSSKKTDAGLDAFHKAMAADPGEPAIPKMLGMGLMASAQFESAIPVWQEFLKAHPDDFDGNMNLGHSLAQLKRYSEAAAVFATAAKAQGDRADVQANLASAYLLGGEPDKAGQAYLKLANDNPNEKILNNAAYEMAEHKVLLPQALDFAKKAVRMAEEQSQKIALPELSMTDVRQIYTLMAYWDTLGWVLAESAQLDEAAAYLHAAWKLTQDGVVGRHLCDVYERMHKTDMATRACNMAEFRMPMSSISMIGRAGGKLDFAEKPEQMTKGTAKRKSASEAADLVINERTFKLPRFLQGTEWAEFFLLFSVDGKSKTFRVDDVKFVSGSDKMKTQGKQLKAIDFDFPAPGEGASRFVRRGILGCYQYSGCSFVLLDPETVHSVN